MIPGTSRAFGVLIATCVLCASVAAAAEYRLERLVPASPFRGLHGMDFDPSGRLYAADLIGMTVHRIDVKTGASEVVVGPPYGGADDVKVGPDGTVVWTNLTSGVIYARSPGGVIRELATGLPGINTVGFHPDGRLFATQPRVADALYEIDLAGKKPPRVIFQPSGALNGFVIKPDGYLYGPQGALGTVVRVDLATGTHTVLADGFRDPTAVKSDSAGNLFVSELATGRLYRLDQGTWKRTLVAQLSPGNDNITISGEGLIYVSNFAHSSIEEVDPRSGAVRTVARGGVSVPGGLALQVVDGREWLYIADMFTTRRMDPRTGEAEVIEQKMGLATSMYPSSATITGNHLVLSSWTRNEVFVQDLTTLETVRSFGGLKLPHDATWMGDGTFVIAEMGAGRVVQVDGDGKLVRVLADGMDAPLGIARDGERLIYVTDARAGTLSSLDLQTGELRVIARGFVQPEGIALDRSGWVVLIDAGARALLRVDPGSGRREILLTDLPIGLQGPPPMHRSWIHNDVAVGRDGAIYFSSDVQPTIYRLMPVRRE